MRWDDGLQERLVGRWPLGSLENLPRRQAARASEEDANRLFFAPEEERASEAPGAVPRVAAELTLELGPDGRYHLGFGPYALSFSRHRYRRLAAMVPIDNSTLFWLLMVQVLEEVASKSILRKMLAAAGGSRRFLLALQARVIALEGPVAGRVVGRSRVRPPETGARNAAS